jgi:hypothetical protein
VGKIFFRKQNRAISPAGISKKISLAKYFLKVALRGFFPRLKRKIGAPRLIGVMNIVRNIEIFLSYELSFFEDIYPLKRG